MLERLYRISEANKNCGVTITSAVVINPVSYPAYPPELKIPEYEDPKDFVNPPGKISIKLSIKFKFAFGELSQFIKSKIRLRKVRPP